MKIRFITPDTSDVIGHDSQAYFEREVKRQVGTFKGEPDWVFAWYLSSAPSTLKLFTSNKPHIPNDRSYKVTGRVSDLHHYPRKFVEWLNGIDVDLLLFSYQNDYYWKNIKAEKAWLPWSYEPSIYYPTKNFRYDVSFLGSTEKWAYPLRWEINRELPPLCKKQGWRLLQRPRPPFLWSIKKLSNHPTYLVGKRYAEALRSSKVTILTSSVFKYLTKKWVQSLGSETCVLADAPHKAEELGLKEGENYININMENWQSKLRWILDNEGERHRIAQNGLRLAQERHTHEVRAKEMLEILRKCG